MHETVVGVSISTLVLHLSQSVEVFFVDIALNCFVKTYSLGNQFLELTSEILTARGGPKLEVGGACTSVAVDLGDVEGRYPDVVERWKTKEKELSQQMDWQAFKSNYDQVSTYHSPP